MRREVGIALILSAPAVLSCRQVCRNDHGSVAPTLRSVQTPRRCLTQPTLRLDLDRMDHNDNRLFGITTQISWMPKPSYQVTLRTPLYAVRN